MKLMYSFACALLLVACRGNQHQEETAKKEKLARQKAVFGHPFVIDSSHIAIIPIGLETLDDDSDLLRLGSYSKSGGGYSRFFGSLLFDSPIVNLIFFDEQANTTYLFQDSLVHILDIDVIKINRTTLLFHEMVTRDLNLDGKLNKSDIQSLFVSAINGKNLRMLSPPNESVMYWKIDWADKLIYMHTQLDSDENKVINEFDLHRFYCASFDDFLLRPIVPEDLRDKITRLVEQP